MKPDQEMHVAMEEPDLEPCDLFVDIGLLIIEGRTPLPTARGYGEGPHCLPALPSSVQKPHICNAVDPQCNQHDNFRKHMLLLWKNSIPMSIEVLLCPDCCYGNEKSGEATAGPEPNFILLEQWTVQMLPRRAPESNISARALMQAVRSYLHFSQLSAWYSLTSGKAPKNVVYRVCVPGEVFSNKFTKLPDEHVFPMANVNWNNILKVSVKAVPRSSAIPQVACPLHEPVSSAAVAVKGARRSPPLEAARLSPEVREETKPAHALLQKALESSSKKDGNPSEIMLGESLLDPPQLLEMYPKRYQSPSRSGSPVMETPEHWMFGGCGHRGRTPHRPSQMEGGRSSPRSERGRPWQRSERPDAPHRICEREHVVPRGNVKKLQAYKSRDLDDDELGFPEAKVLPSSSKSLYSHLKNSVFKMSPEETVQVLQSIVKRQPMMKHEISPKLSEHTPPGKFVSLPPNCVDLQSKSADPLSTTHGKKLSDCSNLNGVLQTKLNSCPTQNRTTTNERIRKCVWVKGQGGLPLSPLVYNSTSSTSYSNSNKTSSEKPVKTLVHAQHSNCSSTIQTPLIGNNQSKFLSGTCNKTSADDERNLPQDFTNGNDSDPLLCNLKSYFNSNEKRVPVWTVPGRSEESDEDLTSLQSIIRDDNDHSSYITAKTATGKCLNGNCLIKTELQKYSEDECNGNVDAISQCRKEVPTASDKAKFRRSLDSAANLVFHSRNGLPLTSSPAPMRKGTRFDFDSSLTSVSAIKHALFDKDEAEEAEETQRQFSKSAPSTVTNNSNLLGNFEESVLNGRLEPVSTVEGFTAEIGASGSFCPRHIILPVTVFFYTLSNADKVSTPYMGHINLGKKGYHVPKSGTIQVTLFNPHGTVVKMFVVMYDLRDMSPRCQTFLRQRTLYMPVEASAEDPEASKWLRYLIHLRFASSKSGRIYLHTDIRIVIFRKSDMDAATIYGKGTYELRSFTKGPTNPRFSPRR